MLSHMSIFLQGTVASRGDPGRSALVAVMDEDIERRRQRDVGGCVVPW